MAKKYVYMAKKYVYQWVNGQCRRLMVKKSAKKSVLRWPNGQVFRPDPTLLFNFAIQLWKDGSRFRRIREKKLNISRKEFAKMAGISVQKLSVYERAGKMTGDFWMFCNQLENIVAQHPFLYRPKPIKFKKVLYKPNAKPKKKSSIYRSINLPFTPSW